MFVQNIPRRKIYETLLEYEDALIDMQIILQNKENFKKHVDKFNKESFSKIEKKYREIKALLIMFIDNRIFRTKEEFELELKKLLDEEKKSNWKLFKNRNFPIKFKLLCLKIDNIFKKKNKISSIKEGKNIFEVLDKFNSMIPKILELRRDKMK